MATTGFNIDVRGDMNAIIADMSRMKADVADKATVRALNKTAAQVKTNAARQIRDVGYQLKVGTIKRALKINKANAGKLTATVVASGRPIPLMQYGARQTAKGVSVSVLNGRKVIQQAFIATMPSGHTGVFIRTGKTHKKVVKNGRVQWSGLPIKELFGPSVPNGLANESVQQALQQLVEEKFPQILRQQIDYLNR